MYMKFDWNLIKDIIKADWGCIQTVWAGFSKDWQESKFVAWRSPHPAEQVLFWDDGSIADTNHDMPSIKIEYIGGSKTGLLPVGKASFPPEAEGERETTNMAIKTPTTTKTPETPEVTPTTSTEIAPNTGGALAIFGTLNMFDIPAPKQSNDLFPQVKIPYPIEMGDKFPASSIFQVGLFDGNAFSPVAPGSVFTVLAAREATRKLTTNDKGEKNYERAFKPMGAGFDTSAPLFEQHLYDPQAECGVSYLVAIVTGEQVALAEIPAFKVMRDFWGLPLHQALVSNGMGAVLKKVDVTSCQTASKKDPTKKYLDPKKFNVPAFIVASPLTEAQLKLVIGVLEANAPKFEAWARR